MYVVATILYDEDDHYCAGIHCDGGHWGSPSSAPTPSSSTAGVIRRCSSVVVDARLRRPSSASRVALHLSTAHEVRGSRRAKAAAGGSSALSDFAPRVGVLYWQSHALAAAARLRLADVFASGGGRGGGGGPRARRRGLGLPALRGTRAARRRSARGIPLAALEISGGPGASLKRWTTGCFGTRPLRPCCAGTIPNGIAPMLLFHNHPINRAAFAALERVIQTGRNGLDLTGQGSDVFAAVEEGSNDEYRQLFSRGMRAVDPFTVPALVQDYDYAPVRRLIDLGGATGTKSRAILRAHPHIEAVVVVDLPHVIDKVPRDNTISRDERVSYLPCDLLKSDRNDLPCAKSQDLYLMVAVLHGLDDRDAVTALQTVRRAIGTVQQARLLVVEMLLQAAANELTGPSFDCMMMVTSNGKERTLLQFVELFEAAGFRLVQQVPARTVSAFLELAPV